MKQGVKIERKRKEFEDGNRGEGFERIQGPDDPSSDRFEEGLGSCMKNGVENAEGTDPSSDPLFTPRI